MELIKPPRPGGAISESDSLVIAVASHALSKRLQAVAAEHSPIVQIGALALATQETMLTLSGRDPALLRLSIKTVVAQIADFLLTDGVDIAGDPQLDPIIAVIRKALGSQDEREEPADDGGTGYPDNREMKDYAE